MFGEKNVLYTYEDRKKMKWNGFYLSDHTAKLSKQQDAENFIWPVKERLSSEDIDRILYEAKIKNLVIAIQKEALTTEGHYLPDIVGNVMGYDVLGIYVADEKIDYDEIRNVEIIPYHKWSQLN